MGTITVNIEDETEKEFRKIIKAMHGKKKGSLGKAITEAMKKWIEEKRQERIADRQLALMKKGLNLGKKLYKKRAELYER